MTGPGTEGLYGFLTVAVALAAFVVAFRLCGCLLRCRVAPGGRPMVLLSGIITLIALGIAFLLDAADNLVWHSKIPIIPSAWLSTISGAVVIVWFEAFGRHAVERAELERSLKELATTDPLTGILNRRACLEKGELHAEAARRYGRPMAVLMIDIDHFKKVNDRLGHQGGDRVLCRVVSAIGECLRNVDVFGRLGGEEFAVIMPQTDAAGASIAAERIRAAVEAGRASETTPSRPLTISIGVMAGCESLEQCLKLADHALYRAKREGRNRVVVASSEQASPEQASPEQGGENP
jgi:diguanylate cyclase (GGDEF)-like protein